MPAVRPYQASRPPRSKSGRLRARRSRKCCKRERRRGGRPGGGGGSGGGRGRPSVQAGANAARKSGSLPVSLRASGLPRGARSTSLAGLKAPPRSVKMLIPLAMMLTE